MSKKKKAIVVGSGIAGLASAIRLATRGFSVQVYEKNTYLGGKLTEIQLGDYRFDAGPSLFTMPQFVEELFQLADKNPKDYFSYVRSETACHYFFEDGTFLPFPSDKRQLIKDVSDRLGIDPIPLSKHLSRSEFIYNKTHKTFLEQSLHQLKNYFSFNILESIVAIPRLHLFSSMSAVNEKYLNHPKLVQIFNRYATYNGSNPYEAPGILNVIPHLEHGFGTYFPVKGMHDIPQSLIRLGIDLEIDYFTDQNVEEITVINKKVRGIVVNGKKIPADVVVCNSDIRPAYKYLLPSEKIPSKVQEQEPSSSALIFYWGMKKKFAQLDLHNIFFAEDYKKEFDTIFKEQLVDDDPTVYIHVSSKMKADDAPEDGENWFVMINVPANSGQNWQDLRKQARKNILNKLSRLMDDDIAQYIEEEDYLDPIRIENRTSSHAGALYGASSNDRMAAFFRHPNFSKVKGLHFVGGSVHPGGGIPLCLLSAKIAVSTVEN